MNDDDMTARATVDGVAWVQIDEMVRVDADEPYVFVDGRWMRYAQFLAEGQA